MRNALGSLLVTLLVLGAARGSRADDPRESARDHYARGLTLAGQNGYEAALREFNEAYAISPQFAVLYNIGQVHVALGHPLEAIEALSRYLRDGQNRVPPARRAQVEAQIALLESRLAELFIATDRPGVWISIDGQGVGRTPLPRPIRLAAGTHAVSALLDDGAPISRVVTLREAGHHVLDLDLSPPSPEADAARLAALGAAREASEAAARAVPSEPSGPGRTATLAVRCAETGIKVLVDGKGVDLASATRGISVPAGQHRFAFAGAGRRGAEQPLAVPAGATAIVICEPLSPAPSPAEHLRVALDGPPVFGDGLPAAKPPEVHASAVGYAFGGLGLALGGAALGVYVWNQGQYDDSQTQLKALDALKSQPTTTNDFHDGAVRYNALADSIHRANYLTAGLALAGGASLAVGVYLWLKDRNGAGKPGQPARDAGAIAAWWGADLSPGGISWHAVW